MYWLRVGVFALLLGVPIAAEPKKTTSRFPSNWHDCCYGPRVRRRTAWAWVLLPVIDEAKG